MKKYSIDIVADGELGDKTVLDRSSHPPKPIHLHLLIQSMPTSSLFSVWPFIVCSDELKQNLEASEIDGITYNKVEAEKDLGFDDLNGDTILPGYYWLVISGSNDQIQLDKNDRLLVSEKILNILKLSSLQGCIIQAFE